MSVSLSRMFPGVGCGDNSCVWGPMAVGANGGCRCYERSRLTQEQMKARLELHSGIHLLRELAAIPKVEAALRELVLRAQRGPGGGA